MEATATAPANERRLVVLISGTGSNLQAILDACATGRLPGARVVFVVSNRADALGLERAERAGVATAVVPAHPGEPRQEYDGRLAAVVAAAGPDVVVLAGFMRLLTMAFLGPMAAAGAPVVNLHPAHPGELPGTHAIERAYAEFLAGARTESGVMVHLVPDEGVDDGPVLATRTVPIHPDDTLDSFAERVHATEHELLVATLAALGSSSTPVPEVLA